MIGLEKFGITEEDIYQYRQDTGVDMHEALKHFENICRFNQKDEMIRLIESGTLEDILKIVKILVDDY
jgi:hypothetical protein